MNQKPQKVTFQPPTWWDGTPIKGWPDPTYIAVVEGTAEIAGLPYYIVRYKGNQEIVRQDRLYPV